MSDGGLRRHHQAHRADRAVDILLRGLPDMKTLWQQLYPWLRRTPVQTFILCPLAVLIFELVRYGALIADRIVLWGIALMIWGYAQYHFVGGYRHPRAGGSSGMDVPPERIIEDGPYRYTRNPMYLGHLIFLTGLAVTF